MVQTHGHNLPEPVFINGGKKGCIALYRYANIEGQYPPVILTHGTFSNARICMELAGFLNTAGFDCWIYEWRGHGQSEYGQLSPDAEGFARHDVPAVIERVLAETMNERCIWVAHSGGGFLPLMYMARNPYLQHQIKAIVGMGSQTTGAGETWFGRLTTMLLPVLIQLSGRMPGPLFGLGPEDEVSGFLAQWCRWNRTGKWVGKDGFDYDRAMENIHIPTFLIAGGNDLIAPAHGCRHMFHSLGSTRKKYALCAKTNGYLEDYNHPRLIASQNARVEIWPMVLAFILSEQI